MNSGKLKKGVLVLSSILLLNSHYIFGQQKLTGTESFTKDTVLKESFENNKNNWISDNEYLEGKFTNGVFLLKCKNFKGAGGLTYINVPMDLTKDFEIEASIEIIKGSGGLVFGMNDKLDHYRIELTNGKDLVVLRNSVTEGKIEKLFTVSNSSEIKKGTLSRIRLSKQGSIYYLFLNDKFLKEISGIGLAGNRIGFNVAVNSEMKTDFLNISYLNPKMQQVAESNILTAALQNDLAITWISPSPDTVRLSDASRHVKARVKSKAAIDQVMFTVNGKSIGQGDIIKESDGIFLVDKLVEFKSGSNTVYFTVTNEKNESKQSVFRYIINTNTLKPVISWVSPTSNSLWNSERITLEVCIKSPTILSVVDVIVNGDSRGRDKTFERMSGSDCDYLFRRTIDLKEGVENKITINAENEAGTGVSDLINIIYNRGVTEKRLALVIGNSKYLDKSVLKNPENDANLMAGELEKLGFEVIKRTNATLDDMTEAIKEFNQKLDSFNVALFYYAGHGIQVDGSNYLVPIDAKLENKINCDFETIALNNVVNQLKRYPDNTNIVILDACRNNPFREWARGSNDGFKFLPSASGILIGYATAEGAKADDGSGYNGIYTEELVKQMQVFQPIESVFKKTMVAVEKRTGLKQSPQVTLGLRGDFYFMRPVGK